MGIALPAFATTATIESKHGNYEVKNGETVNLMGRCAAKAAEGVNSAEWTIDGIGSKANDGPQKGVHFKSFVAHGSVGHEIHVKFQCMTDMSFWYTNDAAFRTFKIVDSSPPTITWDPSNAAYAKESITIEAMIFDSSGVGRTWIRWPVAGGWSSAILMNDDDGGSGYSKNVSFTIDVSGLPEGVKNVQIQTEDQVGNNTGWLDEGSFTVDRSAPAIDWDNTNAQYAATSITIDANVSDAVSGVADIWLWWPGAASWDIRMNKVSGDRYRYTIDTSKLPAGAKNVQFWARDKAGNDTNWQVKGSFIVDRTMPTIALVSPQEHSLHNDDLKIVLAVKDDVSGVDENATQICWMQQNANGNWPSCTHDTAMRKNGSNYEYTIPVADLKDGELRVGFNAKDNAGNTDIGAWTKRSFKIDKTAPVVNWFEPLDQAVLSDGRIHVTWNIVDENPDYVVIEWQAENATAWQSHNVPIESGSSDFQYDLSGLTQDVNYRLRLHAADKAGNVSGDTSTRTVIGQFSAHDLFKNSQLSIQKNSLVDKDNSGGYSQGDDFIYRLEINTNASAAKGLSLRYALPDGLAMTPNAPSYFDAASAITDNRNLNSNWNGNSDTQLLADNIDLPADRALIVNIPVTLTAPPAAPMNASITSTAVVGAKNAKGDVSLEHRLTLQDRYPSDLALHLQLESMQADWKYKPGTAFDYKVTVSVLKWPLTGIELRYALPAGLQKNGDPHIVGAGAAAIKLNPDWGDRNALLLSSQYGAMLAARNSFTVTIPVRIADTAVSGTFIQSEVQARARNLIGPVPAMHRIRLEGPPFDEEQLRLKKTVDKKTALPGEILHYTITFTNVSTEDLNTLVIKDDIQSAYLTLRDAQCGQSIPDSLQCCVSSEQGDQCGTAIVHKPGALEWHLNGILAAGDSGSVSYEAQVNQK